MSRYIYLIVIPKSREGLKKCSIRRFEDNKKRKKKEKVELILAALSFLYFNAKKARRIRESLLAPKPDSGALEGLRSQITQLRRVPPPRK